MKINKKWKAPGIIYHFTGMHYTVTLNYLIMFCSLLYQLCLVIIAAVIITVITVFLVVVVILKHLIAQGSKFSWACRNVPQESNTQRIQFPASHFLSIWWKEWGKLHYHMKQIKQGTYHVIFAAGILPAGCWCRENASRSIRQVWSGTTSTLHF